MKMVPQQFVRKECLRILESVRPSLEPLKNTELVLLGGTGFLGAWLIEMLSALNDDFGLGVRSMVVSRSTDQFVARFPHLGNRTDLRFQKSDVRQLWQMPMEADWVIHAAASPDTRAHASNPLDTASVIVDGATATIRAAERMSHLRMLMFLSSGLVSGRSEAGGLIDETATSAPAPEASFVYAGAKRFAETLFSAARSQCRIPTMSVRPFSLLGAYQPLDRPFAHTSFISDALRGSPIRVQGDGSAVRSYMYGADAAYWLLRMLTGGKGGDVFNLGSDEAVDLRTVAMKVASRFQPQPEVMFNTASRAIAQDKIVPSIARAKDRLGLQIMTPFDQALAATVDWNQAMHQQVRSNDVGRTL